MNKVQKNNIYFFYGPDEYRALLRLQEWKEAFAKKYGQGSVREIGMDESFSLNEVSGESSIFNPITLTVIRDPFGDEDANGLINQDDFISLLQKPAGNSHFLFWQRGSLPSDIKKKIKLAADKGKIQVYEFEFLTEDQAVKFLATEFKKSDLKITKDAAETLAAFCVNSKGMPDSGKLIQAVRQLVGYCWGREVVTLADVQTVVSPTNVEDMFLPTLRAFSKKNSRDFQENLDSIFQQASSDQELLGILSALFEQVKNMLVVLRSTESGMDLPTIDKSMEFKPGRSRYVLADAKKFGRQNLETILDKLLEIEYNVKQGKTILTPELANLLKQSV